MVDEPLQGLALLPVRAYRGHLVRALEVAPKLGRLHARSDSASRSISASMSASVGSRSSASATARRARSALTAWAAPSRRPADDLLLGLPGGLAGTGRRWPAAPRGDARGRGPGAPPRRRPAAPADRRRPARPGPRRAPLRSAMAAWTRLTSPIRLRDVGPQLLDGVELRRLDGPLVGDLGQDLLLDVLDQHLEAARARRAGRRRRPGCRRPGPPGAGRRARAARSRCRARRGSRRWSGRATSSPVAGALEVDGQVVAVPGRAARPSISSAKLPRSRSTWASISSSVTSGSGSRPAGRRSRPGAAGAGPPPRRRRPPVRPPDRR